MYLIASIMGVAKPVTICAMKNLSSTSVVTASNLGLRLRGHRRSVWCYLRSYGLSGNGGMAK